MESWDRSVDVVVVGLGGAGVCAALQARDEGASVLVIDRFRGGGATAISGGVVYAGATEIQRQAGVRDDATAMLSYLRQEVKGVVSDDCLQHFCEESSDNLRWLQNNGVPFDSSLCPQKTSYPTDDYYLYYSGNEAMLPYREKAVPAPRGHRAKGRGLPGQSFFRPLLQSLRSKGAELILHCRAEALVQAESGRVTGLCARRLQGLPAFFHGLTERWAIRINHYRPRWAKALRRWGVAIEKRYGRPLRIQASKGIILSTGGFIYNREMVRAEAPSYRPGMPLGTAGCDGSGITMARQLGAGTAHMDRVSAWRFINPPLAFVKGMLVNRSGQRYVNEGLYGAAVGEAMVEEQGGEAVLILDQNLVDEARRQVGRGKSQWFQTAPTLLNLWFARKKGGSLEELARRAGLDSDGLCDAVATYNEAISAGRADPLGKDDDWRAAIDTPPYYAIDCSIDSRSFPCPTLTLGGLTVDERSGQVLNQEGQRLPGLYAAGRAAVGICSRQYVSGLSLADCVFSGRRAGRHAAEE